MKYWMIILILLFSASCANAIQIKATWELNDPAEQVDGYILYERIETGANELLRTDAQTNEAFVEHEGGCKTYLLTAYKGDIQSQIPAVATYGCDFELPPIVIRPGTPLIFNITIQND